MPPPSVGALPLTLFYAPPLVGGCDFNWKIMNSEIQPTSPLDLAGVAVAFVCPVPPAGSDERPEPTQGPFPKGSSPGMSVQPNALLINNITLVFTENPGLAQLTWFFYVRIRSKHYRKYAGVIWKHGLG